MRYHPRCVACSPERLDGLGLVFRDRGGTIVADFECTERLEGYPGVVHGGVLSLILDSAMVNWLFARGVRALTAELSVRFLHPVVIGRKAEVTARIIRARPRLSVLEATIRQDGAVMALAQGKFLAAPASPEKPPC